MAKKGKKIRKRTPEEQEVYEMLLPRLLGGESVAMLASAYGLNQLTVRDWKKKAKKKQGLSFAPIEASNGGVTEVIEAFPEVQEVANLAPRDVSIQKNFMVEQASGVNEWLVGMRSKVGDALSAAHEVLVKTLTQLTASVDSGTKLISASYQGDIVTEEVAMGPSDYNNAAVAIKACVSTLADLHCLPLKAQSIEAFKEVKDAAFSPHLHLHSHGDKNKSPARIAATPAKAPTSTLDPQSSSMLSSLAEDA